MGTNEASDPPSPAVQLMDDLETALNGLSPDEMQRVHDTLGLTYNRDVPTKVTAIGLVFYQATHGGSMALYRLLDVISSVITFDAVEAEREVMGT
jgi:hypothetical protein